MIKINRNRIISKLLFANICKMNYLLNDSSSYFSCSFYDFLIYLFLLH